MSYSFILADSMKGDYAFPLPILFLCLPADYRIMTRSIVVIFFLPLMKLHFFSLVYMGDGL